MTKSKLTFLVGGALMLGATMCQYSPDPKSGEMSCADTGKLCPDGFECSPVNGKCYRPEDMPQAPPSTGGTTAATTASTAAAGGATGGTTLIATSSKAVVTGGQMGGAPSSPTSTTAAAGATIPITIIGGSIVSTTATGGGSIPLASIAGGAGGSPGGKPVTGGALVAGAIAGVTAGGRPMGGASVRGGMTAITTAAGGSTISSTAIITPPSGATVTFSSGKAVGAMTGYGWVAMGSLDILSDPTCGPDKVPLTAANPCATVINWNSTDAFCISGSLPAVDASDPDYANNWGFQIGISATEAEGGLGQSFSTITFATSGSPRTGLRAMIHRKGDLDSVSYCAPITGSSLPLTKFSTACYDAARPGTALTAADVPNIDRIGVQIPSNTTAISVVNFCVNGITFGK